jgi:hypothetical protein
VTPRISGVRPPRRPPTSTLEEFRQNGDFAKLQTRAFWRWTTSGALEPGADAAEFYPKTNTGCSARVLPGAGFSCPRIWPSW